MNAYTPLILLSSERSGTNLLRAIIGSHSSVASPPPCGIVGYLADRPYQYLFPSDRDDLEKLILNFIALTQSHFNKWEIVPELADVKSRVVEKSYWSVFRAINDIYAEQNAAKLWFSKEPQLFNHVYEIAMHMPDAKFIYMVRDGRDVAASMIRSGVHENHVYSAARRWSMNQRLCLNAISDPLLNERIFMLKYEDVIHEPESTVMKLMKYIGVEYESMQIRYYNNDEFMKHSRKSSLWKNLAMPIDKANNGKYRTILSKREIQIFESVAWEEMRVLDYPLESEKRKKITYTEKALFLLTAEFRRGLNVLRRKNEFKRNYARNISVKKILNTDA